MADQTELTSWPKEEIPDADDLFMRIHKMWFKADRTIIPKAFQNQGEGLSTDWSKWSPTPEETRQRARLPEDNAVARLNAGQVRKVPGQRVERTPLNDNRAHTDVFGKKDEQARIQFRRIAEIVLPLPA